MKSILKSKTFGIAVTSSLGAWLVVSLLSTKSDIEKPIESNDVQNSTEKPIQSKTNISKNDTNVVQKQTQFVKSTNNLKTSYKFTHIDKTVTPINKLKKKKSEQEYLSRQKAKALYQRQQYIKSQQNKYFSQRKSYQNMQRVLMEKNPNKILASKDMMNNKQVRQYLAKQNYIKRQSMIQNRLKMQNKVIRTQN